MKAQNSQDNDENDTCSPLCLGPFGVIKADAFVGLFNSPEALREQLIFSIHFITKQNKNRSLRALHGYTVIKSCVRTRPKACGFLQGGAEERKMKKKKMKKKE